MTQHPPASAPRDILPTLIGGAVGLFFGFMGIACLSLLIEGVWILLLAVAPALAVLIATTYGADRLFRRLRQNRPEPAPVPWARRYAGHVMASIGAAACLIALVLNGPLLGTSQ